MKLYENIRQLRKERGWSQETLAKKTGYTDRSSIAKIEAGEVDLSQSKIVSFAEVFGVDPVELMGIDENSFGADIARDEKEEHINYLFRLLTPDQQQLVTNLIESLLAAKKS